MSIGTELSSILSPEDVCSPILYMVPRVQLLLCFRRHFFNVDYHRTPQDPDILGRIPTYLVESRHTW